MPYLDALTTIAHIETIVAARRDLPDHVRERLDELAARARREVATGAGKFEASAEEVNLVRGLQYAAARYQRGLR